MASILSRPQCVKGLRLSPIEKLDLQGCDINQFDGQASQFLRKLTWLSVANNPFEGGIMTMAAGFPWLSLQHLDLNETRIDGGVMAYLLRYSNQWGSNLKSLTVFNNSIQNLGYGFAESFPKLKEFSCSRNSIFECTTDIIDCLNMSNIRVLDMSWQTSTTVVYRINSPKKRDFGLPDTVDSLGMFPIAVSSTLEILDISHNNFQRIPEILLLTQPNIQILRAIHGGISNITKPIHCRYRPTIREIDVTNNSINYIHQDVFTKCDWTSTKTSKISGNSMGSVLKSQGLRPFFKPLSSLAVRTWHVDITASTNSLYLSSY